MFVAWLDSLFGRGQCCKKKEKVNARKKYVRLTDEQKKNLVTDAWVNRLSYEQLANKYNISESTVSNIIRKAKNDRSGV